MGQRQTAFHPLTYEPDPIDICGSFAPNNTSSPVATSNVGDRSGGLWSVTRTGVGLFLVTFVDTLFAKLVADANLVKPAASGLACEVVGYNPTNVTVNSIAPATMQIRIVTASTGAATDAGPTAGLEVDFWVRARTTNTGGR